MIVIDASVWVSRLVSGDVHHEASRRWLAEQIAQGMPIVGPSLLLAEIAGAISRQTGRPRLARSALRLLERVPGLRLLPLDQRLGTMAGQLAATLGLRGADAVYVATARMLGVPLMTWDLEQRERGGRVVSVRSPPDSF
jgi:predicted nucleic acid-binding protein